VVQKQKEVVCTLDGAARKFTVAAEGCVPEVLEIPLEIECPVHLACNGFVGTQFTFMEHSIMPAALTEPGTSPVGSADEADTNTCLFGPDLTCQMPKGYCRVQFADEEKVLPWRDLELGFSADDAKAAGLSAQQCKERGVSATDCGIGGYTALECMEGGFSGSDLYPLCAGGRATEGTAVVIADGRFGKLHARDNDNSRKGAWEDSTGAAWKGTKSGSEVQSTVRRVQWGSEIAAALEKRQRAKPPQKSILATRNLWDAARDNKIEEVRSLLESGQCFIDRAFDNERTALHNAARSGFADVAQLLLEAGCKVDPLAGGWTPLHNVSFHGSDVKIESGQQFKEVAELLLVYGASLTEKTHGRTYNSHKTAKDWAQGRNNHTMVDVIDNYAQSGKAALQITAAAPAELQQDGLARTIFQQTIQNNARVPLDQFKVQGNSVEQCAEAGYTAAECMGAGYSARDLYPLCESFSRVRGSEGKDIVIADKFGKLHARDGDNNGPWTDSTGKCWSGSKGGDWVQGNTRLLSFKSSVTGALGNAQVTFATADCVCADLLQPPQMTVCAHFVQFKDVTASSNTTRVDRAFNGDHSDYWESSGSSGTHYVMFELQEMSRVSKVELWRDTEDDQRQFGSYSPETVEVEIGTSSSSLSSCGRESISGNGWQECANSSALNRAFDQPVRYVKIWIRSTGSGTNCKVRGIRISTKADGKGNSKGEGKAKAKSTAAEVLCSQIKSQISRIMEAKSGEPGHQDTLDIEVNKLLQLREKLPTGEAGPSLVGVPVCSSLLKLGVAVEHLGCPGRIIGYQLENGSVQGKAAPSAATNKEEDSKLLDLLSAHGSVSVGCLPRMFQKRFGQPISIPAGMKLKDVLREAQERGICRLEDREMPCGPRLLWVHVHGSTAGSSAPKTSPQSQQGKPAKEQAMPMPGGRSVAGAGGLPNTKGPDGTYRTPGGHLEYAKRCTPELQSVAQGCESTDWCLWQLRTEDQEAFRKLRGGAALLAAAASAPDPLLTH
jgi:hypothetical protein